MKVILLSHSDSGGAGRAAYRLHQGLKGLGADSQMLVQFKSSDDSAVFEPETALKKFIARLQLDERLDALPLRLYHRLSKNLFSLEWVPDGIAPRVSPLNPDVINLHWVCHGYVQIETLTKFNKPLVWTLHDMWAFTGGCHYNQDCTRYKESCGACPELDSGKEKDVSRWVWERKAKAWKDLNLTIVSPSLWLAKCASSSSLFKNFRVEAIPNGIDTQKYKPVERRVARNLLNLPQDKQLILFGAMDTTDRRKGFHLLQPALQSLSKSGFADSTELVVFGASAPNRNASDFGFKAHYLGRLSDDVSLALVYAAADVFIAPSVQDNLPNTVMESLTCGTPCVGFNIGGLPEMIEHQQTGYLARPYEIEDLARGISWVLENPDRHQKLSQRARQKAEKEFTLELQACRYLSLFTEIEQKGARPN